MAALCNRAGHIYFHPVVCSSSSSFFPRLISAVADCMSTILPHMVWPWCEFRMQVWNVLRAARWKCRTQKSPKSHHLGTIAQLCRAISSQIRHISTIGKKLFKQRYLPHMSAQYSELRPTSGWDRSSSLGLPCKFQRVSRLGSVTTRHYSSGRQPNFAALNIGRHLYLAGRPSRWALVHISSFVNVGRWPGDVITDRRVSYIQ